MTSFPILDLVAGLIFIYFLLALINNSCLELYSGFMGLRAVMLEEWIKNTFEDAASSISDHVMLNGMSPKGKTAHYMNGKSFGRTIAELVYASIEKPQSTTSTIRTLDAFSIDDAIDKTKFPNAVKKLLHTFVAKTHAQKKLDDATNEAMYFEGQIEHWFDSIMERLTGHYKRKTVLYTFIFATITAVALNVDSLQLASYLYNNPDARQKLASASYAAAQDSSYIRKVTVIQQNADALVKDSAAGDSVKKVARSLNQMVAEMKAQKATMDTTIATLSMSIPIGWPDKEYALATKDCSPCWFILKKTGGLLMTILAICLGAPFWFDVLGKVANLRSSLKPVEKK